MMGPSEILDFPLSIWMIIFAFPTIGFFQYFVFIPIIPEMLERIQVSLDVVEGEDEELDSAINDKVNDAYGVIYAMSNFVGPLAGSYIYEAIGGRATSDYMALMNFVLFIVLFVFNCGPFVMQEHKVFISKLNELKEKAE